MAAAVPILATGSMLGLSLLENSNAVRSARDRAALSSATARAEADLRLAELQNRQAEEAADRRSALQKAQARTRSLLASRGVGSSGGALLQGLAVEAAAEQAFADADLDLQKRQLELGVNSVQQRNLLSVSDAHRRAQVNLLRTGTKAASAFKPQ